MKLLCRIKHKWVAKKSFPLSETFHTWLIWRGFECERCGKRKLVKDGFQDSVYADNLAFPWRDREKSGPAQILTLVKK